MPVSLRLASLLIPTLALALPAAAADVADHKIRYSLCRSNVASSSLLRMGEGYGLLVQLERLATSEFARLLERYPKQIVEIVFGDRVLLRATASSMTRNGRLMIAIGDVDATRLALDELKSNLWEGPCGVTDTPSE